ESHGGTDLPALRTYAKKDGDSYILNGEKMWITSAPVADFFTVFAKVEKPDAKEMSVFLLEKGTPGFQLGKNIKKMGLKASLTSELFFDNCRIPARNLLGEEGKGIEYLNEILLEIRVMTGALAVGVAQAAFESAVEYSKQREAFGKPIGKFQAIQMKLADMAVLLEASRILVYQAAWRSDQKLPNMKEASIAKLIASEAAVKICDEACRIFGGYGYAKEYPVERYFRDARFTLIGGGTSEILKMIIAREISR
ncbi:MAG: acyl-CoA dehydrogenase, partial [Candidatus Schekmanbacteria bacterium RBG_13_48_7]